MTADIIFVGLARNCEPYLSNFFRLMDALHSVHGLRTFAVIGENGSTDGTREALTRDDVQLVDTSFMADVPSRLERMARGRQHVSDIALNHAPRAFCVMDLDNTLGSPPHPNDLVRALEELERSGYFAFSAQSQPFYYDLLAYEDERLSFSGLDQTIAAARKAGNPLAYYRLFRDVIYAAQRRLSSAEAVDCISAFNGLCLYRADAFRLGSYTQDADFSLCEHVNFNRTVHRHTGKRMQINPLLRVAMPREHGPTGPLGFAAQRVRKGLAHLGRKALLNPV